MTDEELVDALCEIDAGLSGWELTFVESIASHVKDMGYTLSYAQRKKALQVLDAKG